MIVQEQDRLQRLVLSRGADPPIGGKMSQERGDLRLTHPRRVTALMIEDKPAQARQPYRISAGPETVGELVSRDQAFRMRSIDLNADLGEGQTTDADILAIVSSASIACGFHAGDEHTMRATIEEALQRGVVIGAHPGYPDRAGFGRRETGATPAEISELVLAQLELFARACAAANAAFAYVKPHGALYNRAAKDRLAADAIAAAVFSFDGTLSLLGPPGSALLDAAKASGLASATEAFVDRAYEPDGSLVPRNRDGALITDPDAAAARGEQIVLHGTVATTTGENIPLRADSLCVHGDSPGAVHIARAVRTRLEELGVQIESFARR